MEEKLFAFSMSVNRPGEPGGGMHWNPWTARVGISAHLRSLSPRFVLSTSPWPVAHGLLGRVGVIDRLYNRRVVSFTKDIVHMWVPAFQRVEKSRTNLCC